MKSKIIGFTISKNEIDYEYDIYNTGFNKQKIYFKEFSIIIWGIGDIGSCIVEGMYSLSFPLTKSLDERNVLITLNNDEISVENDWLSSIPIFYNTQFCIVSTIFNVCLKNKYIDDLGFNNFLSVGHSIYGKTPFKEVQFLRYNSKIIINTKGLLIHYKDDALKIQKEVSSTEEINNLISKKLNKISINLKTILPLSGGFDSRYLGFLSKSRNIDSYSYSLTKNPDHSHETIIAKKVAKKLNFKNHTIQIENIIKNIDSWHTIFGSSVHLHGMYQMDFYEKIIKEEINSYQKFVLSGIVGDLWSGKYSYFNIGDDINKLFLSHNNKINGYNVIEINNEFYKHKTSKKFQIIELVRSKMILLSYLLTLPEYSGLLTYSPFLDKEVVFKILQLPKKNRKNRKWQIDLFRHNNLQFKTLFFQRKNFLDLNLIFKSKFPALRETNLIADSKIINDANYIIKKDFSLLDILIAKLHCYPYVGFLLRKFKIRSKILSSYNAYTIIKSIEKNLYD
tara:strand:- start:3594 stop:5117 length:1524 start_codon:yes stop_codon:yes gene_type:complete